MRQRTYKTKAETDAKKPVTSTIVLTLLFISVVVPMLQYWGEPRVLRQGWSESVGVAGAALDAEAHHGSKAQSKTRMAPTDPNPALPVWLSPQATPTRTEPAPCVPLHLTAARRR